MRALFIGLSFCKSFASKLKPFIWHLLVIANNGLYRLGRYSFKRDTKWQSAAPNFCLVGADIAASLALRNSPESAAVINFMPYQGKTGVHHVRHAILSFLKHNDPSFYDMDVYGRLVFVRNRLGLPVDIGYPQSWLPHRLTTAKIGEPNFLAGKVALLGGYWGDCNNFYHFVADTLGDLAFLQSQGQDLSLIDYFVLPFSGVAWQSDLWLQTGIPLNKIVPVSCYSDLKIAELIVPVRAKGSRYTPTWLPDAIRALLKFNPTVSRAEKLLYISRKDATKRVMLNEDDIIVFLLKRGFSVVECSGLSVTEQQRLFSRAAVIVAPHGAALTNLLWCQPQTAVIELRPSATTNRCFAELCIHAGLDYYGILGVVANNNSTDQAFRFEDMSQLEVLIKSLVGRLALEGIN